MQNMGSGGEGENKYFHGELGANSLGRRVSPSGLGRSWNLKARQLFPFLPTFRFPPVEPKER